MFKKQKGFAHILILLAAVGLIIFLLISNSASFKDKLFGSLFPKPSSQASEQPQAKTTPDEIVFKFKPGIDKTKKEELIIQQGLTVTDKLPQVDILFAHVPAQNRDKVIEALKHNPNILYAEPHYILETLDIPNDTNFVEQWNLKKINAPTAWDMNKGNASVAVAVVDSGLQTTHEDFKDKLWINPNEIPGNGIDDDNDGHVDDINGWNFIDANGNVSEGSGHGTLVSGVVAAATNNAIGIASLGRNISIMPVRVCTNTGGCGMYMQGILYAADHGAKAINISIGASCMVSQAINDTINYAWSKGSVIVASSGNNNLSPVMSPACLKNVIAVGSSDSDDNRSSFSNYGTDLDVVAPGSALLSTNANSGYQNTGGTSIASPHVAALAGLLFSANPNLTNQQVVDIITSTTDDLTTISGWDEYTGWGKINAAKAIAKAMGDTRSIPDVTSPQILITAPQSGTTISGTVNLSANVVDPSRISKVTFNYFDSSNPLARKIIGTVSNSPFVIDWDTTTVSNGSGCIGVLAYDNVGNIGQNKGTNSCDITSEYTRVSVNNSSVTTSPSATATPIPLPSVTTQPTSSPTPIPSSSPIVNDSTPPSIIITSPINGSKLPKNGSVKIQAQASDVSGIFNIQIYFDNTLLITCTGITTCSTSQAVNKVSAGTHIIKAIATDNSTSKNSNTTIINVVK
jgi:thermitase